ncbi:MAG: ABC transporter permease [Ardenticatenaceae bacterium]|nr:ABC transporter permease [Ardenticatenaceae bacterium]
MNKYIQMSLIQAKLFFREPIALFFTIAFPVLLLVMYGAIFGNDPNPNFGGFGYIDSQVPGLTAIIVGTIGLIGIPVTTANNREQKVLRRFMATPMPSTVYLAADILVNFVIAFLGMMLLIVIAIFAFDLRFGGRWIDVLAAFSLSTIAFFAVGYLIAGVAQTGRVAQVVGQVAFLPMMFLSGATLPLNIMPEGVQQISSWLPLTHVVKLLQAVWFGSGWETGSVAMLLGMSVVGITVGSLVFQWE